MNQDIIKSWANLVNEGVEGGDFDDDYETRFRSDAERSYGHYDEAVKALKSIFSDPDEHENGLETFVAALALYKKHDLQSAAGIIDNMSPELEKKRKFLDFFKAVDRYVKSMDGIRMKDFVKNDVYESENDGEDVQEIVMGLDLRGWEQDGDGPVFVNVGGDGERKEFNDWSEAGKFLDELCEKD